MSLLTEELKKFGFQCGIEFQAYIQNTGKYTSLIIEGKRQAGDTIHTYDFYKVKFYKNYSSRITVYEEHLTPFQLLKRVKSYLYYRKNILRKGGRPHEFWAEFVQLVLE
ncbi:hypothetical protein [Staphylococcus pseudintermedius]